MAKRAKKLKACRIPSCLWTTDTRIAEHLQKPIALCGVFFCALQKFDTAFCKKFGVSTASERSGIMAEQSSAFALKLLLVVRFCKANCRCTGRTRREYNTEKADLPQNNWRLGMNATAYIVFATANTSGTKLTRRWRFEKDV